MTKEDQIEQRWQWMLNHENRDVRVMAERLGREPVLRKLFPFTSVNTLFRFSETTEWPYTVLPFLEINRDDMSYEVRVMEEHPVAGRAIAKGMLEEMVPILVHEVTLQLEKPSKLFHH